MTLIQLLYFMITHITGIDNVIAVAIARFQMQRFTLLAPNASPLPDPICAFPTPSSVNYETSVGL